jgi:hypothetical protein
VTQVLSELTRLENKRAQLRDTYEQVRGQETPLGASDSVWHRSSWMCAHRPRSCRPASSSWRRRHLPLPPLLARACLTVRQEKAATALRPSVEQAEAQLARMRAELGSPLTSQARLAPFLSLQSDGGGDSCRRRSRRSWVR